MNEFDEAMNKFTMKFCQAVTFAVLMGCALVVRAGQTSWTDEETENYWGEIAEKATRTSTSPRFEEADEAQGEGILEAFGAQYLPNAYAHYQEVRAAAKEREQLLKENFPDGRSSDSAGGALYDKVRKATAKAVAEMFRRHDELCHYLLLYRMGAVSDQELADLDSARIAVVLPEEAGAPAVYERNAPLLASSETDFATKYLPETGAAFQRLDNAFSEGVKTYGDWRKTALLVDATRSDALFQALRARLDGICDQMDAIVRMVKEKNLLHAVGETTASELADADREKGLAVQRFEKELPVGAVVGNHVRKVVGQLKESHLFMKRFIENLVQNMVQVPGRNYGIGKYEVSQKQWMYVMGTNPSCFEGENNPVENVSWEDCQEFLRRLNSSLMVKTSGVTFRLPTDAEWEYACRAGATGKYCRLKNGSEITVHTLDLVAWYGDNSDASTHPVGQKNPNAWGLYDMIGNVGELTLSGVGCGGDWEYPHRYFDDGLPRLGVRGPSDKSYRLGFRLCADSEGKFVRPTVIDPTVAVIEGIIASMIPIPGKDYRMGKTEVTHLQWDVVMGGDTSCFGGADNPMENVSWADCQMFLKKLNGLPAVKESGLTFRLPTEAEWEFACRAGATGKYCRLADGTEITERTFGRVAWFRDNADRKTHPVGRKQPNAFGLYDMLGNVEEWTATGANTYEEGQVFVVRGGSFFPNDLSQSGSSYRLRYPTSFQAGDLGFRLCADGEGKTGSAVVDSTVPGVSMMGKPRMGVTMLTFHGAEMSDGVWPNGVIVTDVEDDSPAARAGLRAGDVILKANENRIVAIEDLTAVLIRLKEGNPVNLKIWRPDDVENAGTEQMGISMSGKNMDVRVILAVLE